MEAEISLAEQPESRGEQCWRGKGLFVWRSFRYFDGRCSLRTWVYRVAAHNVAASHIVRNRRVSARLVNLEELASDPIREVAKSGDGSMRAVRYSTEIIFEPIGVARNFNNS